MRIALLVAGWLLITATVIPLIRKDAWWIRVFDFPRVQICVVGAVVILGWLATTDRFSVAGVAVETDAWWQTQLRELESSHPFTVHQPQPNTYGMLLYSRLELTASEVKFLVQHDIPSIHARVKLACGQEVALHCMHPRPPSPTESDSSGPRDAELLLVGKSLKNAKLPVVVMGDLNDVAWSRTNYLFQDVSGLLDPRIGRGFFNTFHARYAFMRFPLDHFFHSNHFRLTTFRRLGYFGSDHFPVFIDLSYEPDAEDEQPQLQATSSQQEEADEKIADAN